MTTGFKGGLSSRAAYVVADESELAPEVADYLEVVAKPYFNAVVNWLENLRIGMRGGDMCADRAGVAEGGISLAPESGASGRG